MAPRSGKGNFFTEAMNERGGAPDGRPASKKRSEGMKPRITVITIGVDDLKASLRFYRNGLGLQTQGIIGTEFEYGP